MKKKVLALLLAIVMAAGLLPGTAFAAGEASGVCGDDLTWSYSDGVLTIEGTGPMYDYSYGLNSAPWVEGPSQIKESYTVVIRDGVTSIGSSAFNGNGPTGVTIPDSVRKIGDSAFQGGKMTELTIPDSVISIGGYAFRYCRKLTDVVIPDGVKEIGYAAFEGCDSLASVTIPNSVTSLAGGTFQSCGSLTSVVLPEGITGINMYTFSGCTSLTSVTIPASVTSIYAYAFTRCTSLKEIRYTGDESQWNELITEHMNETGNDPLKNAAVTYIKPEKPVEPESDFVIENGVLLEYKGSGGDVIIPGEVTAIGPYAFYNRTDLTGVDIPGSVKSIGEYAFYNCDNLEEADIPDSVTSIGEYAFYFSGLHSVTLPKGLTRISTGLFACSSIRSVEIPDGVTSIGDKAFTTCYNLTSVTIPDSVTSIGGNAFSLCYNLSLKDLTLPARLTSIGESAFEDCANLTGTLVIPNKVTSIGDRAFYGCKGLTGVTISNSVTSIGRAVFANCIRLTGVTIPDRVTSLGDSAFSGCEALTEVTIPTSVTSIAAYAFYGCESLAHVYYAGGPGQWHKISISNDHNDALFSAILHCAGTDPEPTDPPADPTDPPTDPGADEDFVIENGVLLKYKGSGGNVTIPNGVTVIGDNAFWNCTGLTGVTIPTGVTAIEGYVFSKCTGLTSVTIPAGVTSIGSGVFDSCSSLTTLTIPASVTSMGNYVFSACVKLKDIYYGGTESQWNSLVGNYNSWLKTNRVTIHYGSTDPKPAEPETPKITFDDVKPGDWFYDAVYWAVEKGITDGTGDTTFSPKQICTEGHILTFLWRAEGKPAAGDSSIHAADWCQDAVDWAYAKGLINKTFNYRTNCTRARAVWFIWKVKGAEPPAKDSGFTDVPAFYADAVSWAVENGVTDGKTATTFDPEGTCMRREIVSFLYRAYVPGASLNANR